MCQGSILHLYCGLCRIKTLLIRSNFPSFVFVEGEMDLLEMHAFGVQFNLIDRECILNLKVCGVWKERVMQQKKKTILLLGYGFVAPDYVSICRR